VRRGGEEGEEGSRAIREKLGENGVVMHDVIGNVKAKTYGLNAENGGAVGEIGFVLVGDGGGRGGGLHNCSIYSIFFL